MEAFLIRTSENGLGSSGYFLLFDKSGSEIFRARSLELPWLNNKRGVSSIPLGTYTLKPRISVKYGQHFIVTNVPGRSLILIHAGNSTSDTKGCILLGERSYQNEISGNYFIETSRKKVI